MHQSHVNPGVSELPRGNALSRDHVNRTLIWYLYSELQPVSGCHPFKVPKYVFFLKTYFPGSSMLFTKHLKLFLDVLKDVPYKN